MAILNIEKKREAMAYLEKEKQGRDGMTVLLDELIKVLGTSETEEEAVAYITTQRDTTTFTETIVSYRQKYAIVLEELQKILGITLPG